MLHLHSVFILIPLSVCAADGVAALWARVCGTGEGQPADTQLDKAIKGFEREPGAKTQSIGTYLGWAWAEWGGEEGRERQWERKADLGQPSWQSIIIKGVIQQSNTHTQPGIYHPAYCSQVQHTPPLYPFFPGTGGWWWHKWILLEVVLNLVNRAHVCTVLKKCQCPERGPTEQ